MIYPIVTYFILWFTYMLEIFAYLLIFFWTAVLFKWAFSLLFGTIIKMLKH